MPGLQAELGQVTLKSNVNEELSFEFLYKKSNGNEALHDVFS
jgi:hypothetical protein